MSGHTQIQGHRNSTTNHQGAGNRERVDSSLPRARGLEVLRHHERHRSIWRLGEVGNVV